MEKRLILGPPGTGKTTFLVNTFRDLLQQGVDPERIAYVSFTRKAAQEARDRCIEQLGLPVARFPHVKTLHSLAYRENGLQMSDVMQDQHYKEVSEAMGVTLNPYDDGRDHDTMMGFHIGLCRVLRRDPEEHFDRVAGSVDLKRYYFGGTHKGGSKSDFVKAYRFLQEYKKESGLWDYHDMLEAGINCDPLPVDYAIIDEAQDLSPLQWQFAAQMFRNVKTCWIAGDDDQAIYSWAGADLNTFRRMEAKRTVLEQSYRLPETVWKFSIKIAEMIGDRYDKEWRPRDEAGEVNFVGGLEDCPLDNGESWYILTRTRSLQYEYTRWLRFHGLPYSRNGIPAIKSDHIRLANTWTKLQRGDYVPVSSILPLYDYMRDNQLEDDARAKLMLIDPDSNVNMADLLQRCGLRSASGIWHDVLLVDKADTDYYRNIKENQGTDALIEEPKIEVHTMHGVKGGEADNVFFPNSMGRKPHDFYKTGFTRDEESRIFYVAATRAKKRLFIKASSKTPFPIPKA